MAPALTGDRVRARRWERRGATLPEVLVQLGRLHGELALGGAEEREQPHPRNCVLNLVVCVADERSAREADREVGLLAAAHPLRALVLSRPAGAAGEAAGLDAEVLTESHRLLRGSPVQREQVTLRLRGGEVTHIASLVEPLLVSDVPTFLWWPGTPSFAERGLRELLAICDVFVVDSSRFEDRVRTFLDLGSLAGRVGGRPGFADLDWARQRPWRESLAQVFAPPDRRGLLDGLRVVEVKSTGEGPENRVCAALMAGWLAAALEWRLTRAAAVSDTAADALLETPRGRLIQVHLRSAPVAAGLGRGGELAAIRLEGTAAAGPRFEVTIRLDGERGDHAHLGLDLGGETRLDQRLALPRLGEPELLTQVLPAALRDRVYMRSLAAAAALVDALR